MKKEISRRRFLGEGIKLAVVLPIAGSQLLACTNPSEKEKGSSKLKILILGGTNFIGPHQIAYALERGHSITTFNRGKSIPPIHAELFKQITQLYGDRDTDLRALEKGEWDVVIDNSGYNAEWTRKSANLLKERAKMYVYTSSTGVYYPYLKSGITEEQKLLSKEPENIEDEIIKIEYWYGVMKTNSEINARKAFGEDRTLVIRPTYMLGPGDKSNRFIHWPVRLAKGGEVFVPGKATDPVQYVDVRDVAEWMIRLIEANISGTFNAVGPAEQQGIAAFVEVAKTAFNSECSLVQVDDYAFLNKHGIIDLVPWVIPEGNNFGSSLISNKKGVEAGLTFRSLNETMRDTHRWWYSGEVSEEQRAAFEQNTTLVYAQESQLLQAWKEAKNL